MAKEKLKPKFDPIWQSDYLDIRLKKLSRTAFIMRQMYRSFRNPETNLCNLSDPQIRAITGWGLRAIKNAREQLIARGEITHKGYHTYLIPPFHQFQDSLAQKAKPQENQFNLKGETSLAQKANDFSLKGETSLAQKALLPSHPDITDTDIQILSLSPENIKTLKMLFANDPLKIKNHLLMRGFTESDIDKALGKA